MLRRTWLVSGFGELGHLLLRALVEERHGSRSVHSCSRSFNPLPRQTCPKQAMCSSPS